MTSYHIGGDLVLCKIYNEFWTEIIAPCRLQPHRPKLLLTGWSLVRPRPGEPLFSASYAEIRSRRSGQNLALLQSEPWPGLRATRPGSRLPSWITRFLGMAA